MHPADACTRCEGTFGDRFPSSVLAPSPTSTLTLRLSDSAAKHTVPSFPFAYDHPAHAPLRGWVWGVGVWGPQCPGSTVWIVLHRGPSRPAVALVSCVRAVSLETVNRVHILALFIDYYMAAVHRPFAGTGTFCSRTDRGICCAPVWNNEELQLAGGGGTANISVAIRADARTDVRRHASCRPSEGICCSSSSSAAASWSSSLRPSC